MIFGCFWIFLDDFFLDDFWIFLDDFWMIFG